MYQDFTCSQVNIIHELFLAGVHMVCIAVNIFTLTHVDVCDNPMEKMHWRPVNGLQCTVHLGYSLGLAGQSQSAVELVRLGCTRSRQWTMLARQKGLGHRVVLYMRNSMILNDSRVASIYALAESCHSS